MLSAAVLDEGAATKPAGGFSPLLASSIYIYIYMYIWVKGPGFFGKQGVSIPGVHGVLKSLSKTSEIHQKDSV